MTGQRGRAPMTDIGPLRPDDRPAWEELFRAYMAFYERDPADDFYADAWGRLIDGTAIHGFGARDGDALVGIVHCLTHASTWGDDVCYLQDLFTLPASRGRGVGRALILAVADWARERRCARVYWLTHESNATARRLYDAVAGHSGFIRYELPL